MPEFDSKEAEAFAGRLLSALNDGALCLMASIGHRTGLFDVMRDQPPQTSDEIAARAGFGSVEKHERAHDIQNNWYVVRK